MTTILLASLALAAAALTKPALATGTPIKMQAATQHYMCDKQKDLSVTYVDYNQNQGMFVVIHYNNQDYGLASAISASGARYASLFGPTASDHGLEWWSKGNEATLSALTGKDLWSTKPLLHCKAK